MPYFGKLTTKGLQILPHLFSGSTFGALAATSGKKLGSSYDEIDKPFLLKKVHLRGYINGMSANQPVLIGYCSSDISDTDLGNALDQSTVMATPDADGQAYLTRSGLTRQVLHETVMIMVEGPSGGHGDRLWIDEVVSVGGKNGIPFPSGAGPALFVYNPADSALTTGGEFIGCNTLYGVWMDE